MIMVNSLYHLIRRSRFLFSPGNNCLCVIEAYIFNPNNRLLMINKSLNFFDLLICKLIKKDEAKIVGLITPMKNIVTNKIVSNNFSCNGGMY